MSTTLAGRVWRRNARIDYRDRYPSDPLFWFSAGSFGLGVLLLGIGALSTLLHERKLIRHLEDIDGFLQIRAGYAERPSARAGPVPRRRKGHWGHVTRRTVKVSKETDIAVRSSLAERGGGKGDLSKFIERLAQKEVLRARVRDIPE